VDTEKFSSFTGEGVNQLLDSSAVSKFALKEPGWVSVEQHLAGSNSIELVLKETGNALWKKIIRGELDLDSAKRIIKLLSETLWLLDQDKYLARALEIAAKHRISIYDSLFLACAQIEGLVLVSCDVMQLEVARLLGIESLKV
jgi:predicted nucleic acid-binding protein